MSNVYPCVTVEEDKGAHGSRGSVLILLLESWKLNVLLLLL